MQVENEKQHLVPSLYVSLRVSDVDLAKTFYGHFGFRQTFAIPDHNGRLLLCFLQYGPHNLILGKLKGLPYPDTPREREIQAGPRGLGVKVAFNVADLDLAYQWCKKEQCPITMEPVEEVWGERIFTCLDPFGYELQIGQQVKVMQEEDLKQAYQAAWL